MEDRILLAVVLVVSDDLILLNFLCCKMKIRSIGE